MENVRRPCPPLASACAQRPVPRTLTLACKRVFCGSQARQLVVPAAYVAASNLGKGRPAGRITMGARLVGPAGRHRRGLINPHRRFSC